MFKEGDMVNLLRVIENEDGSYSPYTDKDEELTEPTFERIVEDNGMLAKMMKLREQMQILAIRRQMRNNSRSTDEASTSDDSDVFVKDDGTTSTPVWDSKCVGQKPIAYKLLNECNIPDKNLQIHENSFEAGEIALKEKHRTRSSLTAFPQETLQKHPKPKSLYSENKGSCSLTKQKYATLNSNVAKSFKCDEKETVASVQSDAKNSDTNFLEASAVDGGDGAAAYGNLQFARLVPKSTADSLELEEDAQEIWEIHDSSERLKESSTTCKIGVLKRRQSVDYSFDAKLGVENSQREVADLNCYKNSDFEVFGGRNFYQLPQFISNPSAIPPQYAPKEERMCDYILGNILF